MGRHKDILRKAHQWVRIKVVSWRLRPMGAWLEYAELAIYNRLRNNRNTLEEQAQYEDLRKKTRKYRKIRRQAAQTLRVPKVNSYGVAVYLEYRVIEKERSA